MDRLAVIGYVAEDIIVRSDDIDAASDVATAEVHTLSGGSAANVAAWASHLGASVRFFAYAGADEPGQRLLDELDATGVETVQLRRGRTPRVVCLLTPGGGKRRLIDPGGSFDGQPPRLERSHQEELVHLPAFVLFREDLRSQALDLCSQAIRRGIPISVDVSSGSRVRDFGADRFCALLQDLRPSVIFMNDVEAAALSSQRLDWPGVVVVTHRGSRPTTVQTEDEWVEVPVASQGNVVDATGAGDAFAAGFLVSWAAGGSLESSAELAHRAASEAIRNTGARPV